MHSTYCNICTNESKMGDTIDQIKGKMELI